MPGFSALNPWASRTAPAKPAPDVAAAQKKTMDSAMATAAAAQTAQAAKNVHATAVIDGKITVAAKAADRIASVMTGVLTWGEQKTAITAAKTTTPAQKASISKQLAANKAILAGYQAKRTTWEGVTVTGQDPASTGTGMIVKPPNPQIPSVLVETPSAVEASDAAPAKVGVGSIPVILLIGLVVVLVGFTAAGGLRR